MRGLKIKIRGGDTWPRCEWDLDIYLSGPSIVISPSSLAVYIIDVKGLASLLNFQLREQYDIDRRIAVFQSAEERDIFIKIWNDLVEEEWRSISII